VIAMLSMISLCVIVAKQYSLKYFITLISKGKLSEKGNNGLRFCFGIFQ